MPLMRWQENFYKGRRMDLDDYFDLQNKYTQALSLERLKMKKAREQWFNECEGDKKYASIENNTIVLHIGNKCKHTFTFQDIGGMVYSFRDDTNKFIIFMSEHSSTNKGNDTEAYYYNINRNDIEYEFRDVSTLLTELEKNSITLYRVPDTPDTLEFSNNIKNNKTIICPIFHGWHIEDKALELEGIIVKS